MLKQTKRVMYKQGLYTCKPPKGDTTKWTIDDWCDWIDAFGYWEN